MDPTGPPRSNARAIFLVALLLTLLGLGGIGFFVFLIGPGFLAVLVVFAAIGLCHYLLWGRAMDREVAPAPPDTDEPETDSNGWSGNGHVPRRF